jgi:curli production assembly/transport component CsgG
MMKYIASILIGLLIAGCTHLQNGNRGFPAETSETPMQSSLESFPPIGNGKPVTVAVYNFIDKTGQRKPSEAIASLSSAVTQGGEIYLIKALMDLSKGRFFNVVERNNLDSLIKERQLIRNTRSSFDEKSEKPLAPLQFAGVLIEGGIVGYDSNKATGGAGVRWLGIGPQAEWRMDVVTVGLRLVSVLTGQILVAITTEKTILSTNVGVNVFKFYDMGTNVLEIEAGTSSNEPVNYAVRQAIEKSVLELVKDGKKKGLWSYNEPNSMNTHTDIGPPNSSSTTKMRMEH